MNSPAVIAEAAPSDFLEITDIYAHYVETSAISFELEAPTAAEMVSRWEKSKALNYPYYVAKINQKLVGYAYASQYRPRPAYRFTAEESVYIHPDFHGRGIARSLLEKIEQDCIQLGVRQLLAVITKHDGNDRSMAFHTRMGFECVGELKDVGFKFGNWYNTIFMQKAIGGGSTTDPA